MKILIVTQKVDQNDDVLGFFHRWLEVFAGKFEEINVKGTKNLVNASIKNKIALIINTPRNAPNANPSTLSVPDKPVFCTSCPIT